MEQATRKTVTVQHSGRIEVTSSELPSGIQAEVIVLVPGEQPTRKMVSMLDAVRGLYHSAGEVVEYLRRERDAWD